MSGVDLVGYCEPISCRPGDVVEFKLSAETPGPVEVDLVELVCGDPANPATGLLERSVEMPGMPHRVEGAHQTLSPGSSATFGPSPHLGAERFTIGCAVRPSTRPAQPQPVLTIGGCSVWWTADGFALDPEGERVGPGVHGRWYRLRWTVDAGAAVVEVTPVPSRSPGGDVNLRGGACRIAVDGGGDLLVVGHGFDGRVGELWFDPSVGDVERGGARLCWDASVDMASGRWVDTGPLGLHGELHQLPARGVRGPGWDGSSQNPATAPGHYDAVHFHTDDLYDAGWDTTVSLELPADLPSGVYCLRSRSDQGEDRTPFFVAAPPDRRADVAFLAPVATYLAYANQRIHLTNDDLRPGGGPIPPNHRWLADHPEVGLSLYEYHSDRSGVMFSSRRRPVMNMKPGADSWGFTPDTNIVAFLHNEDVEVDVVTDEQLHVEGQAALDGYRVLVTGSHPEYWSTTMLDALEAWQRSGGRLMYLGGNGFYWRVAFSPEWPGAMEVRRAEDGTRAWIAEPAEYHHAFGGEYGGLWRRLDRPPNLVCGVGFAAQGFGRGAPYVRTDDESGRTDWIFAGVEGDTIGAHGVGGGAAGQEIDRFDLRLGSPPHAVVVATARDHDPSMLRTKEEFHYTMPDPGATSLVRADMVFYELDGGGAVFSVGSIAWFGALATDGYDNDVARITANVLHRFRDPEPFVPPGPEAF